MRNLTDTMICWNMGGEVALVPWPEKGAGKKYRYSAGACYIKIKDSSFEARKTYAFILATILMTRDKCEPQVVHSAFLGLEEYVDGLPDDMFPPELLDKQRG